MNEREELKLEINRQRAIVNAVLEEFPDSCKEIQLAAIDHVNRWLISNRIQKEKTSQKAPKPPSDKQIKYAKDLGIENPEKYTSKELSKLIDEKKGDI
jgi:hypothetical protein